jgi:hypothetical protein
MVHWLLCKQTQVFLSVIILGVGGCLVRRDDSTSAVRRIVAKRFHVDLSHVKAESSMGELGCTRSEFLDLIRIIDNHFSTTLSPKDDPRLSGNDDSWKNVRVIDLANMVRPEWNKPEKWER